MPTKKLWLKFDCSGIDMFDLIKAFAWRVDPVRSKIFKLEEEIEKIELVNVEETRLPPNIKARIEEMRNHDNNEANLAVRDFILGYLTLWIPTEVHKHIRKIIDLEIGDIPDKGFTKENISALLEEMRNKFEEIKENSKERVIIKPVKEVFEQSVAPHLGSLAIGQHEIISKMATKYDISKMASKDDVTNMSNKMDKEFKKVINLLNNK